jgi:hypothetical protein
LERLPNKAQIPGVLNLAHTSLESFSATAQVNPSLSAILSQIPEYPSELLPYIQELERGIQTGEISAVVSSSFESGSNLSKYQTLGAYPQVSTGNPLGLSSNPNAGGPSSNLNLQGGLSSTKAATPVNESDIWHTQSSETLFQIVSQRVSVWLKRNPGI